ncbi:LADA_0D09406g1_1 [Lachancea dasiensis]|uniref:LADA_0D09406g1_1 n=1 Tax=Lachancea dasiensis TaxID=1072105 RepID=A0A1G4J7B2_9SACH|nr:LADA_0D09406g1_1 [Lachancea dasiensis]
MNDDYQRTPGSIHKEKSHSRASSASHSDTSHLAGFVFPDLRAIYNLKLHEIPDLAFTEVTLFGFEVYLVEQWILERKFSTIITSYTGSSQDIVHAVKFALPESPHHWPTPFKKYYEELTTFAAPKWTEDGTMFVSTSSQIPSTLNLLHLECGDLRKIWDVFKVNIDLKRLQCGGRSALLLCEPSGASCEKFAQLYKVTATTMGANEQEHGLSVHAVDELVSMIQISLTYFNLLDFRFKDGILCVFTEKAIVDWWSIYGTVYLGCDRPRHEGPLGPITVAALVSLVLTVFFKLTVVNCMSTKEPFDEEAFYGGIYQFQKKYGLLKAAGKSAPGLDPVTISKLFEVTPKISNTDIFKIKKVVKSTVQDIAGKGNPVQLSNGILTTDLDYLTKNVHGSILCFLWRGKNLKYSNPKGRPKQKFRDLSFNRGDPTEKILKSNVATTKAGNEVWADSEEKLARENEYHEYVYEPRLSKNTSLKADRAAVKTGGVESEFKSMESTFHIEMHRRSSAPFLPEDVNLLQLDYENVPRKITGQRMLDSRRVSFSVIQDAVDVWRYPFEPSMVKCARDSLKLEKSIKLHSDVSTEVRNDAHFRANCQYESLQEVYAHLQFKLKELDQLHYGLEGKYSLARSDMTELDSLVSKLKYDLRSLEVRMREVDERVGQFCSKINNMAWSIENDKVNNLMTSSLYNNPKKLDRYAQEILESADKFRSKGVLLNVWRYIRSSSPSIMRELHRSWEYLWRGFLPQKLYGDYRTEQAHP